MAPVTNARVLFNEIPSGLPIPGQTTVYDASQTIDPDAVPLDGGFLVKTLVLSIDPYMRGRMRDPSNKSYAPAYITGEPIQNYGVGLVFRSENDGFKPEITFTGTRSYWVARDTSEMRVLKKTENLPWSTYVGVCGVAGQTAHHGWAEYAHPKKGDVVFVSAAAGPVGATVIQLAKAGGCKVIASAGNDEKVDFIRSIGADVAFNYRKESTTKVLDYWDGVGGEILEAAIGAAAVGARFIECGMISGYNSEPYHIKNMMLIHIDELYRTILTKVACGEIKYKEDAKHGLEAVGEAIVDVQIGKNKGKSVIVVAEE
ncbi:hypothetical protein IEO21_08613 [Rhodonia placenta]|uniref:Enoyl reductase (ER) domain-containing protein n=1 Tax=Rhodonia placenta TaxID=104341 RepID=A0A8H7NWC3_9APHY|nr:hypothetical protein IEO21_08613 [Postia placenta]